MLEYSFEPIRALGNFFGATEQKSRRPRSEPAGTRQTIVQGVQVMKALTKATARILAPIKLQESDRLELTLQKDGEAFTARVYSVMKDSTTGKDIKGLASWGARNTFIERVPERSRLGRDGGSSGWVESWTIGATDTTVSIISALWPIQQIVFRDQDTVTMFNYLVTSSLNYDFAAELSAHYQETKTAPPASFPKKDGVTLAPYQVTATAISKRVEAFALFMEMGTGKTAISVTRMCADALANTSGRALKVIIVTPKNVRTNWVDEIEKFAVCKGRTTVIRGGQLDRVKLLLDAFNELKPEEKFTAIIVSYESMVKMMPALRGVEWDLAILDEGHFIKSGKTKRAHAAMELRDIVKKRMLLTGTPITNSPLDLYTQLEFLGKGFSGFRSFASFAKFYGVFAKHEETGMRKLIAFQNMPFMRERLSRYSFIIRKEEALPDLPAKVHDVIEVEMTPEQVQVYSDLRDTLAAEIEGEINRAGDKASLAVTNSLTKLLRLAQITSGFLPLQEEIFDENGEFKVQKDLYRFDPNPKLESLIEILKDDMSDPNNKTIIWAHFVQDIRSIRARLEIEGINAVTYYGATKDDDRENAIRSFNNDPNVRVFIGNQGAGGTGVNLLGYDVKKNGNGDNETNANHVIYYSQDWSSPKRSQSEDRAHRRGTRAPVRITDLVVPGSIDEEIRIRVLRKRTMAFAISDVREILKAVLKGVLADE